MGDKVNLKFDFTKLGQNCPLLGGELREHDFVAVMHSVFYTEIKRQPCVQFGIYNAILLGRP